MIGRTAVRTAVAVAGVLVLAIAVAVPTAIGAAAGARASGAGVVTAGFPAGVDEPGIFTDTCQRTLTAPNDPILMPGMTGKSMQHDFFGAPVVTASTTTAQLRGGGSRCTTTADASAYWTPVLYQDGTALRPESTLLYWRTAPHQVGATHPMPTGITLIAGDEAADAPQDLAVAGWDCVGGGGVVGPRTAVPTDCGAGRHLRLVMTFPDCWDGRTLDGAHQTGAVYDRDGRCPADHPIRIPQIVLHVAYPTSRAAGLQLSIGPDTRGSTDTAHADFMNGWDDERMSADTVACVDSHTRCGRTVGPLAVPVGGRPSPRMRRAAAGV